MLHFQAKKVEYDAILSYDAKQWLSARPQHVVDVVRAMCGYSYPLNELEAFRVAKTLEIIYSCQHNRLVLPISFSENIFRYALSHSRTIVDYHSKADAGGSYTFLTNWLKNEAKHPISAPPGLLKVAIDNEQIIGKTKHVTAENKVPASVITSCVMFVLDPDDQSQFDSGRRTGFA